MLGSTPHGIFPPPLVSLTPPGHLEHVNEPFHPPLNVFLSPVALSSPLRLFDLCPSAFSLSLVSLPFVRCQVLRPLLGRTLVGYVLFPWNFLKCPHLRIALPLLAGFHAGSNRPPVMQIFDHETFPCVGLFLVFPSPVPRQKTLLAPSFLPTQLSRAPLPLLASPSFFNPLLSAFISLPTPQTCGSAFFGFS